LLKRNQNSGGTLTAFVMAALVKKEEPLHEPKSPNMYRLASGFDDAEEGTGKVGSRRQRSLRVRSLGSLSSVSVDVYSAHPPLKDQLAHMRAGGQVRSTP